METTKQKADNTIRLSHIIDFVNAYPETLNNLSREEELWDEFDSSPDTIYSDHNYLTLGQSSIKDLRKVMSFYNIKLPDKFWKYCDDVKRVHATLNRLDEMNDHDFSLGIEVGHDVFLTYSPTFSENYLKVYINKKSWAAFSDFLNVDITLNETRVNRAIEKGEVTSLNLNLPTVDLLNKEVKYSVRVKQENLATMVQPRSTNSVGSSPPITWSLKQRPTVDFEKVRKGWIKDCISKNIIREDKALLSGAKELNYDPEDLQSFKSQLVSLKRSDVKEKQVAYGIRDLNQERSSVLSKISLLVDHHLEKENLPFDPFNFQMTFYTASLFLGKKNLSLENTKFQGLQPLQDLQHVFNAHRSIGHTVRMGEGFLGSQEAVFNFLQFSDNELDVKTTLDKDIEDNLSKISHSWSAYGSSVSFQLPLFLNLGVITEVRELWDIRFANLTELRVSNGFSTRIRRSDEPFITWYEDPDVYNYVDASRIVVISKAFPDGSYAHKFNADGGNLLTPSPETLIYFHERLDFDTDLNTPGQEYVNDNLPMDDDAICTRLITPGLHIMDIESYIEDCFAHIKNMSDNAATNQLMKQKVAEKAGEKFNDLIKGAKDKLALNGITYTPNYIDYEGQKLSINKLTVREEGKGSQTLDTQKPFNEFLQSTVSGSLYSNTLERAGNLILETHYERLLDKFTSFCTSLENLLSKLETKFSPYNDEYEAVLDITIGEVSVELKLVKNETKSGNIQTYWYINDNRMVMDELEDILKKLLNFRTQDEVKEYIDYVNANPLKYQHLMESGVTFQLKDPVFNVINSPVTLKFGRKKSRNYLIFDGTWYKIKNSTKFLRLANKTSRMYGRYPDFDMYQFLDIALNDGVVEGFPSEKIGDLIIDGVKRYVHTISKSQNSIKRAEDTFDLEYRPQWSFEDGTTRPGYKIEGKLASYIIQYDKKESVEDINPRVFDYPTGKYRCMIDKVANLNPVNALINRIYALSNDSILTEKIDTLTD